MTKNRMFGMVDCWGCGEPVDTGFNSTNGPWTAGCPGCDPQVPLCEKQSDMDDVALLHPNRDADTTHLQGELVLNLDLEILKAMEDFPH